VVFTGAVIADFVNLCLGFIDDGFDFAVGAVTHLGDFGADVDDAAQNSLLRNDFCVKGSIRGSWYRLDQSVDVRSSPGPGEFFSPIQHRGDGDGIRWLTGSKEVGDRCVDQLVTWRIEVFGANNF